MLITFVALYLLASIAVGLWFARRVKNTADFAVAGRSLPLPMIIGTTFATWFGAETVIGIPAKFLKEGMSGTVEDPWGASFCLIFVGMFFASRLYKLSLLTVNDYFRERYGMTVEVFCAAVSVISYLGWVAAQIAALGGVFSLLTDGAISQHAGQFLGAAVVLLYTLFGGMWSVAVTDFIQMIVIVGCLAAIAWVAGAEAGGVGPVVDLARQRDLLRFLPPLEAKPLLFFLGSAVTIMFGSIPQQDVFQRVMSAKNERTAVIGPIIGGVAYLLFAFVPMFVVTTSFVLMPEEVERLVAHDAETVLPTLVVDHMPLAMKICFFGALLSAIMSTASATVLAPSTVFVQNVLKHFLPTMSDRRELRLMQATVLAFTALVLGYTLAMRDKSVYDLVSSSYQVPLVGAFIPLASGLYWERASNGGAIASIVLGLGTWIVFMSTPLGEAFPQQLAGLGMAIVGMVAGSLVLKEERK